jgi:ectoine hydroxylase-related dioxygenase (phytanoyl-CoA dioxygenase family)
MRIQLTEQEKKNKQLEPSTLEFAVALVKADGYVIIDSVYSEAEIECLHTAFKVLLQDHIEKHGFAKGGNNIGGETAHARIDLPFVEPFATPDILIHPITMSIVDEFVGKDCNLTYFASNTSLPGGTAKQRVHADTKPLFPEAKDFVTPIYNLVVNIPLVDFHEGNGPMEIWPGGSHQMYDNVIANLNSELLDRLAEALHYERVIMPKGSVMIRDVRMLHRGTPNKSDEPRPNMALIYKRSWEQSGGQHLTIPRKLYDGLPDRGKKVLRNANIGNHTGQRYNSMA